LDNPEILTAVLGALSEGVSHPSFPSNAFEQPRLLEHLQALQKFTIPKKDGARFAKNVVLKIAQTTKDEDIRFMSIAVLAEWRFVLSLSVLFGILHDSLPFVRFCGAVSSACTTRSHPLWWRT
jgi:hypothetical protein